VEAIALRQLAERCARVPGRNPRHPIYAAVLLTAEDGTLTGHATNGDGTWLRDGTTAAVETGGRAAVSARLFAQLATVLPRGPVHLEDTGAAAVITRPGTRDRWTLPSLPAEDFPTWPAEPAGQVVTVGGRSAAAALDLVCGIVAAADVAVRGLRHVELTADGAGLTVRGTDRYRMASYRLEPETPAAGSRTVVVPPEVGGVLAPLAREYERVSVAFPDDGVTLAAVSAGPVRLLAPLLDAAESDSTRATVRRYLSAAWPAAFLADRAELVGQLRRVSWAIDGGPVVLELDDGELTLAAQSDKDARDSTQTMRVDVPADSDLLAAGPVRVGVRAAYLLDALDAQSAAETVRVTFNPSRTAVAAGDAAGGPVRFVTMAHKLPEQIRRAA
jgi:DNA polymerase-3 subunit beta